MMLFKKYKFNLATSLFALLSFSTLFILIYNIFYYSPILGYDAQAHFSYVDYLSRYLPREIRLPGPNESREYFNPPLGYLIPSIAQLICRNFIESNNMLADCQPVYGKVTQVFQSVLYIATLLINLYTLKLYNKSNNLVNVSYLILVSLLAVNYRTISMIRGEPYILFFLSLFLLIIFTVEKNNYILDFKFVLFTGVVIACIALSRQWGFLLFPPLIILLFSANSKRKYFRFWAYSSTLGALLSSWFYIGLYQKFGSFTSFNMESRGFAFSNQNYSFYIPNSKHLEYLFFKPIRPHLDNQFFSILYSDLWGDYWGYFSFTSRNLALGRNQSQIGDLFARVNIISILTSLIIVSFCYLTFKKHKSSLFIRYINLAIFVSFFGYFLFAISFPTSSGDTIKSTYIIQAFHLMVFLASIYFHELEKTNKKIYYAVLFLLVGIYVHNFQTYLSHFPINYYP